MEFKKGKRNIPFYRGILENNDIPSLAATTSTHSTLLYLPVPEVPFPSLKLNEIAKIKLSGKVLWKVLCISKDRAQGEKGRRGGKVKKKSFGIIKSKFPYILHPGENTITSKLVEKNYRRSNKKPRAQQSKMYFLRGKKPPLLMCC